MAAPFKHADHLFKEQEENDAFDFFTHLREKISPALSIRRGDVKDDW